MSQSGLNNWAAWITAALMALTFPSLAQNSGTIKGIVRDHDGAIEFANVLLAELADTTIVISATVTDSLGHFALKDLSNGAYLLQVRFLGFKNTILPVSVTSEKNSVDLGEITIDPDPDRKSVV